MAPEPAQSLLLGRDRRLSVAFLGLAVGCLLVGFLVPHVAPGLDRWALAVDDVLTTALFALFALAASAVHSYRNDGLAVDLLASVCIFVAAFVSSLVPVYTTGESRPWLAVRFALLVVAVACVFGLAGFAIGALGRRLGDRVRGRGVRA